MRLNFGYLVTNQLGTKILEGETQHVCTGMGEKLKRLPDELVSKLQPFLR
jgi:acyl-CoA thioesterase FadM